MMYLLEMFSCLVHFVPILLFVRFSIVIAFLGQMIGSAALSRRTASLDRRKNKCREKKKQMYFTE